MDERDAIIAEYELLLNNWKGRCLQLETQLHRLRAELERAQAQAARWESAAKLGYHETITQWLEDTYGTNPR